MLVRAYPTSCCLKVLLALANNVTTTLRFLVQSCFVLFAFSLLIIAAIVSLAARQPFNTWDHYRVRMSVSYQQPLKPIAPLDPDPTRVC
jgi:hypothetical protein